MIVLLLLLLVLEDADDDEGQQRERPFDHSLYTYILLLLLHFWFLLSLLHAMPFPAIERNAFEYEKTSLFQIQKCTPDEAIMQ